MLGAGHGEGFLGGFSGHPATLSQGRAARKTGFGGLEREMNVLSGL
jgi:hypothetical protein